MANGGRQYDPVASAATSALDTTQRGIRNFQRNMSAPELPAQSQAFSGVRSTVESLSQFSPANVFARGNLPGMGNGGQSLGNLPKPNQLLPGMSSGQSSLPTPDQIIPGMGQSGSPRPKPRSNGSNGSSSSSSKSNGGGRPTPETRG